MRILKPLSLTLIFVAALTMAGCGGGGAKVSTSSTTMGQELTDLEKAHKEGLLSDSEYKKARKNIMKKYK